MCSSFLLLLLTFLVLPLTFFSIALCWSYPWDCGILLAHVNVVLQNPQVFSCKTAFYLVRWQCLLMLQWSRTSHSLLWELHGFFFVEVPLNSSTMTLCIHYSSWFYILRKLTEDALYPVIQIINEVNEQY